MTITEPTTTTLHERHCGDGLAPDGVHPLLDQLRDRGARRRADDRARPRRQGPPGVAGLHVREGAAPRPLPERLAPAHDAAATTRRRHVRGDRLGHRDRRDRRALPGRASTSTAATRSSSTAAAGRGTTSAARYGSAFRVGARDHVQLERAGAGEDRRVLGRRPAVRQAVVPHDRRLRARRGRGVRRARTRGSRTASRRRARSSRRSPTTRTAR